MENLKELSKEEQVEISGGIIGIVIGAFIAMGIWAYDYGKDAAERERRNS